MTKKFIVFVDILGFLNLPNELVKNTKFHEDKIRERLLSKPLREQIGEFMEDHLMSKKELIEGTDDHILLIDYDFDKLFILLHKLMHIGLGHEDYEYIPVEIAVGYKDLDLKVKEPINDRQVIGYLKNNIIHSYGEIYKKEKGHKIKETFIVLTNEFYEQLSDRLKKKCNSYQYEISDGSSEGTIYFYNIPKEIIEIEGEKRLQERAPRLDIGKYVIEKEYENPPHSFHLRFPVIAKNGDCNKAQAKIVSLTRIVDGRPTTVYIRGGRILFWAYHWKEHPHPVGDGTPKYIEDHLRNYHFCSAAPIDIGKGGKEVVNVLVTIQGKEGWFLGNDLFEHEKKGEFEIVIQFSAIKVDPCVKTIRVHIGDSFKDIEVISCS